MKLQKILVPTDFSPSSDEALLMAASLARTSGATLLVVHVEESPAAYGMLELYYGQPDPADEQRLRELLEEKLSQSVPPEAGIRTEHRLVTGDPVEELLRVAREEHPDLIVMATHGRTGLRRVLMGSTAEAVVRRATCPVLTFKPRPEGLAE